MRGKRTTGAAGVAAMPVVTWLCVLLVATALFGPPSATADVGEGAILQDLRQLLLVEQPAIDSAGWRAMDSTHHCTWAGVDCEGMPLHVTKLALPWGWGNIPVGAHTPPPNSSCAGAPSCGTSAPPLHYAGVPPEVAQLCRLPFLELLEINWTRTPWGAVIAPEWLARTAFPRLVGLDLNLPTLPGVTLPDILPGALPALRQLSLALPDLRSTLPAGWGASQQVLPALQELSLRLQVEGGLPAAWGTGLSQIRTMRVIRLAAPNAAPGGNGSRAAAAVGHMRQEQDPPRLAGAGAWPLLESLHLEYLGLSGPLQRWVQPGSFPLLKQLRLSDNHLSGSLPTELFASRPHLDTIMLENNHLTGTLPNAWAQSNAWVLSLAGNNLSGPAIPPAWASANMSTLKYLILTNNSHLTGTLPPDLPWASLAMLSLDGTGVRGSIPAAWCRAPFTLTLTELYIGRTAIDPMPPPCVAQTLHNLRIAESVTAPIPASETSVLHQHHKRQQRQLAVMVRLVTVLLMAVLVTIGFVGRVLWRQRLCLPDAVAHAEQQTLLHDAAAIDNRHEHGWPPDSIVRLAQRGRLAALTSRELRVGSRGTEMVQLPLQAHQLGQTCHHTGTSQDSYRGSHASPDLCSLQPVLSARRVEAATSWAGAAGPPPSIGTALCGYPAVGGGASIDAHSSWSWGLPTHSLRLPAHAIQFVGDADGSLVELGAGTHATVFLVKLHPDDRLAAAKVFNKLEAGVDSGTVWQEVSMMKCCQHPRVVPLLGVALKGTLIMLVTELMSGGTLAAAIQSTTRRSELRWEARGRQVALDVTEALDHLHTQLGVMHSDLKPSNVLLSADWRAYLADMGLAQLLGTGARTAAGLTRVYAAPEQLMGQQCTLSTDMYSLGVLLVSLLTQELVESRGGWRLPRAPDQCPHDVVALVKELLAAEPKQRPTAAQALARLRAAV